MKSKYLSRKHISQSLHRAEFFEITVVTKLRWSRGEFKQPRVILLANLPLLLSTAKQFYCYLVHESGPTGLCRGNYIRCRIFGVKSSWRMRKQSGGRMS